MSLKQLMIAAMALAFANAVTGPVVTAVIHDGPMALATGAGPGFVIWMVAGWCLWSARQIAEPKHAARKDAMVLTLAAGILLIPSAMAAWITCAILGTWGFWKFRSDPIGRSVFIVFAAMALRVPTTTLLLSAAAEPVLALDAVFVQAMLSATPLNTTLIGNVIVGSDGHNLAVMTGCSSFTNVSIGLLAWFAMTRARFHRVPMRAAIAGTGVAITIIFLNVVRLSLMAIDVEMYTIIHDGWGKSAFEGSLVLATLMITHIGLGGRHANYADRSSIRHMRRA